MADISEKIYQVGVEIRQLPKDSNAVAMMHILDILTDINNKLESIQNNTNNEKGESKEDDKKQKKVRDEVNSSTMSLDSSEVPEVINEMPLLQSWTGKKSYRVVYDSVRDGLMPAGLFHYFLLNQQTPLILIFLLL